MALAAEERALAESAAAERALAEREAAEQVVIQILSGTSSPSFHNERCGKNLMLAIIQFW